MYLSLKVVLACLILVPAARPAMAETAGDSVAEMLAEVADLRSQVRELEARKEAGGWLTEQRADEIRSLVADVLADSDTRMNLQDAAVQAGHDRFFFIRSADGNFRLNLHTMIQSRFTFSSQDNVPGGDSTRYGFETPRTRIGVSGHVIDPSWRYLIWGGWIPNGRSWLVEATIMKKFDNGWSFEAGSFKLPLWQEWIISETTQQFIDRSVVNSRTWGAGKGLRAIYQGEQVKLHFSVTDGSRTWNTPWSTGPDTTSGTMPFQLSSEYALTAKAEFLLSGSWASRGDMESFPGDDPLFIIGAGAHYQVGEYGTTDDENEIFQYVVDATAEFGGANIFAGFIGTHFENSTTERDEWGLMVQGGYFLDDNWELIGRYEHGDLDGAGLLSDELSILTVGVTRFWNRHGLKWLTDVGYAFKPVDAAWSGESVGWRADGADEDGQIVIRSQMQVFF